MVGRGVVHGDVTYGSVPLTEAVVYTVLHFGGGDLDLGGVKVYSVGILGLAAAVTVRLAATITVRLAATIAVRLVTVKLRLEFIFLNIGVKLGQYSKLSGPVATVGLVDLIDEGFT